MTNKSQKMLMLAFGCCGFAPGTYEIWAHASKQAENSRRKGTPEWRQSWRWEVSHAAIARLCVNRTKIYNCQLRSVVNIKVQIKNKKKDRRKIFNLSMPQCDWGQSLQIYQCRSTKFKSCLTSLAVLCDKTSRFVGEGRAVVKWLNDF